MILVYCCLVVIRIGGDAVLHFKEIVGVAIHIRFGSCGQTYHDCIEIFEDGTIFLKMLRWLSSMIIRSKCAGVNRRCPFFAFVSSIAFSIVG